MPAIPRSQLQVLKQSERAHSRALVFGQIGVALRLKGRRASESKSDAAM